jgi:hypothetical protein
VGDVNSTLAGEQWGKRVGGGERIGVSAFSVQRSDWTGRDKSESSFREFLSATSATSNSDGKALFFPAFHEI